MTPDRPVVVLDTNIVSYIFKGDSRAWYYEERVRGSHLVISFQTLEESLFGAYKDGWGESRIKELYGYLANYEVIWPNNDLVELCAGLRAQRQAAGRELQMADAWIAATGLLLGCPLASHDRHFVGIPNLEVIRSPIP
jgi:tRNA(fMet)-specific endonuclease VapC